MSMYNLADIKKIIPHRAPILLVDSVENYTENNAITATRYFPESDTVFAGHFPGHPILPGVLGVEALAQTAALLVNLSAGVTAEETIFYFMGIDKVKFKTPVYPEDTVTLNIKQEKKLRNIYRFSGTLSKKIDGENVICTTATFTCQMVLKESL